MMLVMVWPSKVLVGLWRRGRKSMIRLVLEYSASQGSTGTVDDVLSNAFTEVLDISTNTDGTEGCRVNEVEKYETIKDAGSGASSRVAILRDREKDLSDPDYDRSYERYVKNLPSNPTPSLNYTPFTMQNIRPSFTGYHVPRNEVSLGYVSPSPIKTVRLNQIPRTTANAPWPCAGMPYAHTAFRISTSTLHYTTAVLSIELIWCKLKSYNTS